MKTLFIRFAIGLLSLLTQLFPLYASVHDLALLKQSFVVSSKQITIPQYPEAFNPSIVEWNEKLLMCFRVRDPINLSTDQVGFVWLDEEFNPTSSPILLEKSTDLLLTESFLQDPRLVKVGEELYMVYSNITPLQGFSNRRVYIGKLIVEDLRVVLDQSVPLLFFEGENQMRQEKNWVPFVYHQTLLLSYSLQPHRVFLPIKSNYSCESVATTRGVFRWDWGELRGGSNALKIGDRYLAFFHSVKGLATIQSDSLMMTHYFMGAYTFDAEPPFKLTAISSEPIVDDTFYKGPMYHTWKPLRVIFPGGFVEKEPWVYVVYGRQDHEIWVVKLDKNGLLDSLKPIH